MTADIQKLRYEFHVNSLKNLVAQIRKQANRGESKILSIQKFTTSKDLSQEIFKLSEVEETGINQKQKNFLKKTYSDFQMEKSLNSDSLKSVRFFNKIDPGDSINNKFKTFQEKQKNNLKELKEKEYKRQRQLSEKLFNSTREHEIVEEYRKAQLKQREDTSKMRQYEIKSKQEREDQELGEYIQRKLASIEKRIRKSEKIHNQEIKKKLERILKFKAATETVAKNLQELKKTNESEKVNKIIDKQLHAYEARLKIEDKIHQANLSKRDQFEKQKNMALKKMKQSEQLSYQKSQSLEEKIFKSQKLVSDRREQMLYELSIRQEYQRLKDQEKNAVIQRGKRRYVRCI